MTASISVQSFLLTHPSRPVRALLFSLLLCLTMAHTGNTPAHAGSQPYGSGHGINFATGN